MNIENLTVRELDEKINKKELTPYSIYRAYIENINQYKNKNVFAFINDEEKEEEYNMNYAIPLGIEDSIAVEGLPFTVSSKILEGFKSPYNASVIESLKDERIFVLGKTNLNEFGSKNYENQTAISVSNNLVPWALGVDSDGAIRISATNNKIVGFKPSYGLVSNYGVVSTEASFSSVGILAKTVLDCSLLFNKIKVKNEEDKDPNTVFINKDYAKNINDSIKGKKIGVIKELIEKSSNKTVEEIKKAIIVFEELGATVEEISIPYVNNLLSVYKTLGFAEASANLERFDGVTFGYRSESNSYEDMIEKTRTEGFGYETKKKIIFGSYILKKENYEKYYLKAGMIRRKIIQDINDKFKMYDVLISPTTDDETLEGSYDTNYTLLANITGTPAISIPISSDVKNTVGLQIMGPQFSDDIVLNFANTYFCRTILE